LLYSLAYGEKISYVHQKPICGKLAGCNCENLHVVTKNNNGMSVIVINRIMGQKRCYFTILSSQLWEEFRALTRADYELRKFAHLQIKEAMNGEMTLMDLRKFNYNINVRSEMKEMGAEVLAGRAKTVSARHYLLNQLDELAEQYTKAWRRFHDY
jgi:intergrase/recombinase